MNSSEPTLKKNGKKGIATSILLLSIIMATGIILTWRTVKITETHMRSEFINQAKLISTALNIERLNSLSGSESDTATHSYKRIKDQLITVKIMNPMFHSIYLLGRRLDGSIIYLMDSETPGTRGYTPPSHPFNNAPDGVLRAFTDRSSEISGPLADDTGIVMTATVPINDRTTALYGLASPDDAQAIVRKAIDFYLKNGKNVFLEEINNPKVQLCKKDLYAFVYDRNMTMLAHPVRPELVGQNLLEKKDWAGGKYFRKEIRDIVLKNDKGWVDYEYINPVNHQREPKTTYAEGVDDMIVCAGAYKGSGAIIAVLGIDIDAASWKKEIRKSATLPLLLTLVMIIILIAGIILNSHLNSQWKNRTSGAAQRAIPLETIVTFITGLILTVFSAWIVRSNEILNRKDAFRQLVLSRVNVIAHELKNLRDKEFQGLVNFQTLLKHTCYDDFEKFASYLVKNPAILSWKWLPQVKSADKSSFEEKVEKTGLKDFIIWEYDVKKRKIPVQQRDVYYPIFNIAPMKGNEQSIGFDEGSENHNSDVLKETLATGLPTATNPVNVSRTADDQNGIQIFLPVYDHIDKKRFLGFVSAVLKPGPLLWSAVPDKSVSMTLSLMNKDHSEPIATAWNTGTYPDKSLYLTQPVFAFGKVFAITAIPGPEFMKLYPLWQGRFTLISGLVLTLVLTYVTNLIIRRRETLERLVLSRTTAMIESESNFRSFFETIGDLIIVTSMGGEILLTNDASIRKLGYSNDELTGADLNRFIPDKLNPRVRDDTTLMLRGEIDRFIMTLISSKGRQFSVETRIWTGRWNGHDCHFYVCKDLTSEREAQLKFERLFHHSPALMAITSLPDRRFQDVNDTFINTLGFTRSEIIGKTSRELDLFIDQHQVDLNAEKLATHGRITNIEAKVRCKDGSVRDGLFSGEVINIHGHTFFLTVMVDITERRHAEYALMETNRQLEESIEHANRMTLDAQMASMAKSEFLANMSHEIRTPMNGIIGMTQLILSTALDAEQKKFANHILKSSESLLELLNDILDYSKIEAGKLNLEKRDFNVSELLEDFAAILAVRAHDKGLEFICAASPHIPDTLQGDSARIRQILINLTGNAIKFTNKGEVAILADLMFETDDEAVIRFSVRDTGIGISSQSQLSLFQKFSQVDTSITRQYGGTGLGLAISKELVSLMDGEINVNSSEGKGSEFWFTVKLGKKAASDIPSSSHFESLKGAHVLLVDHNPTSRKVLNQRLTSWGITVQETSDGFSAIKAAKKSEESETPFNAAVIDMHIQDMNGFELAKALSQSDTGNPLSAILLTSIIRPVNIDTTGQEGRLAVLSKPPRLSELSALLSAMITGAALPKPDHQDSTHFQLKSSMFRKARILIAEDNPTNQEVAAGILSKMGYTVDIVETGLEALKTLGQNSYDLVLMDIQMPEMDGLNATRAIRNPDSHVLNPDIPIIAMTANAMRGDRSRCLDAGMNDYIAKPVNPLTLAIVIDKWLPEGLSQNSNEKKPPSAEPPASGVQPPASSAPAVFDKTEFMSRLMDDTSLINVVINAFLTDMPSRFELLEQSLSANDIETTTRLTHTIKGAALNVSGMALSALAADLEKISKSGDLETVKARFPELKQQFDELKEALSEEL